MDREIDAQEANAQAALARQANNCYRFTLDKANIELKIEQSGSAVRIENIEANE